MATTTTPFQPLLFGESDAVKQTDYKVFVDHVNQIYPGVNAYDPIGSPRDFISKMNTLKLPDMQVLAVVMSASHIDRSSTKTATLKIPLAGDFNCLLDGQSHSCGASMGGMYLPQGSGRVKGSGSSCSQVSFQFVPHMLEKTARAMLGKPDNAKLDLHLENPRVVPFEVAGQPLSSLLRHIGALIDLHQRNATVLTHLGLQDMLYRHIVMLLHPEVFLPQTASPRRTTPSAALIEQLCDHMQAHLESGLTLTDLETFTGLSARSLQLAFKKHTGCSPMHWLTEQKLHAVRAKLAHADPSDTVTSLAFAYFPRLGDFARKYSRQFGELPSQTLGRQRC